MRIEEHPILGTLKETDTVEIEVDGKKYTVLKTDTIAGALLSNGIRQFRTTPKKKTSRGIFCGIGQCSDCVMIVNGIPNVKTCVTQVAEGMIIEKQKGHGSYGGDKE